ncbi:hypothetical protein [Erwinia persicina]|uniref:Conjugal transfer protein TraS n=1 Tax=Erwinia persicina TaxID=55211 RepID=A0ABR9A083_9GAMM|nr:hypothetical protein [Erwinia persicina]MBD8108939.1 hypothetical protein [Erwinia persicina]MBD8212042.1 hypothetical protein [Erwinia persicina]
MDRIEVKNDVNMVLDRIEKGQWTLPSSTQALKSSALYPMSWLLFYSTALAWIVMSFTPPTDDPWINPLMHYLGLMLAFGVFTALLAVAITGVFYGQALVFFALKEPARKQSIVIRSLTLRFKRTGCFFTLVNFGYAIICIIDPNAFYGAPVMMLISLIVMQIIINCGVARYGIGPLMQKLSALVKKI